MTKEQKTEEEIKKTKVDENAEPVKEQVKEKKGSEDSGAITGGDVVDKPVSDGARTAVRDSRPAAASGAPRRAGPGAPRRAVSGGGSGGPRGGPRSAQGGPRKDTRRRRPERDAAQWTPRTKLGKQVQEGKITTMKEVLESALPIREPEIVDILIPDLEDEVLDVNMVQRMTDSGRRVRFAVTVVVGNRDGLVGLGRAKGKEVGPTIHKAIDRAKIQIIAIKRGCGSWECSCMLPHTVPFRVKGKSGSTEVTFKPSPRGVGLATGDVAKKILSLAGITDVWSLTRGQTRTTVNFAQAAFAALQETTMVKTPAEQSDRLKIVSGGA